MNTTQEPNTSQPAIKAALQIIGRAIEASGEKGESSFIKYLEIFANEPLHDGIVNALTVMLARKAGPKATATVYKFPAQPSRRLQPGEGVAA